MQAIGYRPAHGLRASIRPRVRPTSFVRSAAAQAIAASAAKAALQFIKGVDESCVPDVKLTRSRTGGSGTAVFIFDNPDVFNATAQMGEITGLYMVDEEGVLSTVEVSARFVNGTPKAVEAKYVMRSAFEWDRFMRFMDRYAASNGLGFTKAGQ